MNREEAKQKIKAGVPCKDYLEESQSGMYCCPYCGSGHGEHHTGAVKVYDDNKWACHACGESGDVLDLIQASQHTDYNGALKIGADILGITIDEPEDSVLVPVEKEKAPSHDRIPAPAVDYTQYFKKCIATLRSNREAIDYLASRGISLQTTAKTCIGYDPMSDPAAAPGAITNEGKKHPTPRIIIPTTKKHYIGRAIDPSIDPRYRVLNPSRSKGSGSPGIFNSYFLINPKVKVVFVVEGWADALSVMEVGESAIALNSTSNTKILLNFIRAKKIRDKQLIISFDNDPDPNTAKRTNEAAESLYHELKSLGISAMISHISGAYKDPNEALVHDRSGFTARVKEAVNSINRTQLDDFLDLIQTEAYKPSTTGLPFFDDLLSGGILQQSLMLLMAAPGTGKTTLCQQIAESIARHGKTIIYLNFEMSREQMLAKAISSRLTAKGYKKPAAAILQGYNWTTDEKRQITEEIEEYKEDTYPHIRYNPAGIGSDLQSIILYLKKVGNQAKMAGKDGPAIVVDYLHLITDSKSTDVQDLIKKAIMALKDYAKDYHTFVIAIAATNRDSNRSGKISLSSGRDSSNLEYTADYHLSLNYAEIDDGTVKPDDAEAVAKLQMQPLRKMIVRVLKCRFGTPGKSAVLYFDAAGNRFYAAANETSVKEDTTNVTATF